MSKPTTLDLDERRRVDRRAEETETGTIKVIIQSKAIRAALAALTLTAGAGAGYLQSQESKADPLVGLTGRVVALETRLETVKERLERIDSMVNAKLDYLVGKEKERQGAESERRRGRARGGE